MKVKELLTKLQQCNPEYDIILAKVTCIRENADGTLEKISSENTQEEDWITRVDTPLEQVFQDNESKEVCIFASVDDQGQSVQVDASQIGIVEIV